MLRDLPAFLSSPLSSRQALLRRCGQPLPGAIPNPLKGSTPVKKTVRQSWAQKTLQDGHYECSLQDVWPLLFRVGNLSICRRRPDAKGPLKWLCVAKVYYLVTKDNRLLLQICEHIPRP
eukprot:5632478-Amphidinium_carterae.1